ncbi:MAG: FrgA protein [Myxococcota bacterium]
MPTRLAKHLIARGLLPADRVEEAVRRQAIAGGALDTVLLEQGVISEAGMLQALADVSGIRLVNLSDFEPNPEMAALIPPKLADRLSVTPLSVESDVLHVACSYPVPLQQLQEVGFLLGKRLELWIALECRVRDWVAHIYKQPLPARFANLLAAIDPSRPLPVTPAPKPSQPAENAAPRSRAPSNLVESTTLEESLGQILEEPIPLEVKKKTPLTSPGIHERMETVVLDTKGYAAFAREATSMPAVPPSVPGRQQDAWQVPPSKAAFTPPPSPLPERELPLPSSDLVHEVPTVKEMRAVKPAVASTPSPETAPGTSTREVPVGEVPDWSLSQAREALQAAVRDRDRIVDVALRYARRTFDFTAAFATVRGAALGWDARGEGADPAWVSQVSIPLDAASVFRTVAMTRGSYVGPVPADSLTQHFLGMLGRAPRTVFLFPVEVKGRLVAILYGDSGQKPVSQRKLSDLLLFCQDLAGAFQELIVLRKRKVSSALADEPAVAELSAMSAALASHSAPSGMQARGSSWSPSATGSTAAVGRAAGLPGVASSEEERPPPDFGPVLQRLVGPDAAQRARAMAELSRSPEASARVLAQAFPGPTAWSRLPVVELPEADELGPIPAALSRLGRPGAQALSPLLDSDQPDVRYLALLTAGNLPYPELVDGVLRGLFDLEPDISSAARVAATSLRRLPRFDAAMKDLRQELAARDPLRRSLAARALGNLHDRESIDGLIGLTGSDDQLCAQAAAEALREITKASFGTQPRQWTAWWAENRHRRRAEWLVAALRHKELDIRLSAIEELSKVFNDNLGYFADGPAPEREEAVTRWEKSLAHSPRANVDV